MPLRTMLVVAYAFAALGCKSSTSSTSVRLDFSFPLAVSGSATVDGQSLQVGFDSVVSDSRCPTGAVCIDAGEGVVRVWLSKAPLARENRDLKTTAAASEAVYGSYRIKLVALDPYPVVGQSIAGASYVATLRITQP